MAAPSRGNTIIGTRERLFQVGNSLKVAPFRDKGRDVPRFTRVIADNYCLDQHNGFAGKLRPLSPKFASPPSVFSRRVPPYGGTLSNRSCSQQWVSSWLPFPGRRAIRRPAPQSKEKARLTEPGFAVQNCYATLRDVSNQQLTRLTSSSSSGLRTACTPPWRDRHRVR